MFIAAKTTPAKASRTAPARFTGFIPWNRVSKSKLLHGGRCGAQRFSVMRIEVDAKSNFREFLRNALRVGSVLVGVVALFEDGGGADDVVGGGFAAGWFQGDAHRQALPLSGLADRNEVVGLGPRADLLLDHGAACAELRHDGEETALGCGGDAAVGGVVAEPDHVGDSGVEVRQ